MNEYHPQFWFRAEHVASEFNRQGEACIARWLREQLMKLGYQAAAPEQASWGQRIRIGGSHTVLVDCAAARLITDSRSAPPCWIAEVVYEGGIEIPLESNVAALPTVARVGRDIDAILAADAQVWYA
ncbi:hypothetical protein PE066_19025 [Ramlibacter tataouinensis]|uniref:hypothetical protein n=1 Tax=Ramlibacter tataouinensis TaxID=94132 RepID=UPI0022F3D86E|nr:hypothetical protein [Ramlibacter tataouinensis]WBY01531.1 hypothetical protein PE066_19025 [Ramlibacter tataouinensis]